MQLEDNSSVINILNLYSEFTGQEEIDFKINYRYWEKFFFYLLSYEVINNPLIVFNISWDLINESWRSTSPILINEKYFDKALKYLIRYFFLTKKELGDYRITDLIYKDFPDKIVFIYNYYEDKTDKIELRRNGKINTVKIFIPSKIIEKIELKDTYKNLENRLIKQIKKEKLPINMYNYSIINNDEIIKRIKNINNITTIPIIWDQKKLEILIKKLNDLFEFLKNLETDKNWNVFKKDVERIAKCLALSEYLGNFSEIVHVPSFELNEKVNNNFKEISTGGLIIHCNKDTKYNLKLLRLILNMVNRSNSIIEHKKLIINKTKFHALRSAVAAIMARNMSHNIGSHVLARSEVKDIKNRLDKFDIKNDDLLKSLDILKSKLDSYIKQKSDFLAEISSEPLTTTKSLMLYKEVILPYIMNSQLMDTIAANEGIRYEENLKNKLKIRFFVNRKEITTKFSCMEMEEHKKEKNSSRTKYSYPNFFTSDYPYSCTCNLGHELIIDSINNGEKDIEVELPGPLGEFAIFGFLENFIRNVAKHQKNQLKDKNLEICIQVLKDQNDQEFYKLRIWDNVADPDEVLRKAEIEGKRSNTLKEMIEAYINSSIITDEGKLKRQAWGIAEMKVSSLLLLGSKDFDRMNESLEVKSILRIELPSNNGMSEKALVYEFKVMKAKFAYVLTNSISAELNKNFTRYGVKIFNQFTDFKNELIQAKSFASPKFIIINYAVSDEEKNEFENLIPFMSFRVIVTNDQLARKIPYACISTSSDIMNLNNINEWKEKIWDLWIKHLVKLTHKGHKKQDYEKICLHIYLEQEFTESPTKKWIKFAKIFNEKGYCVKLKIYGKDSKYTNSEGDCKIHVGYDRHGGIKTICKELSDKIDPKITIDKLSSDFIHIFTENIKNTLPFELVEPLLIKIGVADDRLAEKGDEDITVGHDTRTLMEWALGSEVYFISHLKFNGKLLPVHSKVEYGFKEQGKFIFDLGKFKLIRDSNSQKKEYEIQMLILHQGLIDDLKLSLDEQEKLLSNIQKKIPFLIIDSGRGIPPTLSPRVKFLPYSLLEQYLTRRISKYCFVRTCMPLTRRKE